MTNSRHIYLLTSGLFFIGASILLVPNSKNEILITVALALSSIFLLLALPWYKLKISLIPKRETTGKNCINCEGELTFKDIESNICHICGKFAQSTHQST